MPTITPTQLCEIEEIKQLKARYFRFIDTKQWEELRNVFTTDAKYEGFGDASFEGADRFVDRISSRLDPAWVVHHGHSPEIRILSEDTARGIWAQYDFIEYPEPTSAMPMAGQRGRIGYGHYHEEYRKINGAWRISFMRNVRLRVDPLFGKGALYDILPPTIRSGPTEWLDVEP